MAINCQECHNTKFRPDDSQPNLNLNISRRFTMNEVILIYLLAKISSQLKPGSSNSGRHLKAIVINPMFKPSLNKTDRQKSKPIQWKNEGLCNGNNSWKSLVWLVFYFCFVMWSWSRLDITTKYYANWSGNFRFIYYSDALES